MRNAEKAGKAKMSGRGNQLRIMIGALILAVTVSCVKREPRTRNDESANAARPAAEERCALRCQLKKNQEASRKTREPSSWTRSSPDRNREGTTRQADRPTRHSGQGVYHTVKKGETLYRICRAYNADLGEVARANGISDPAAISVGQRIWIPGAQETKPVEPAPSGGRSSAGSPAAMPSRAHKGSLLFPVPGGRISSGFGMRDGRMHEGVDILAPEGSDVLAAADGKVVYADNTIRGYGNMIIVKHQGDLSTVYAHNSKNLVQVGDLVKRGQKIAEVGMTGRASAPHVHFEVRLGEKPVDPMWYLP